MFLFCRQFVVEMDEKMERLKHQITEMEAAIKAKSDGEKENSSSYNNVIQTLTADISNKDAAIKRLTEDTKRLNIHIVKLQNQLDDLQNGIPRSRKNSVVTISTRRSSIPAIESIPDFPTSHNSTTTKDSSTGGLLMHRSKTPKINMQFAKGPDNKPQVTTVHSEKTTMMAAVAPFRPNAAKETKTPPTTFARPGPPLQVSHKESVTKKQSMHVYSGTSSTALPQLNKQGTMTNMGRKNMASFQYRK